ncbi:MAG TPA: hypothetical protein VJV78_33710 [Polyangiales bacterium]|nr:hypothetical protein [Polyangiales bacterium]
MTFSNTILWLKVLLTAATLVLLYFRYRGGNKPKAHSFQTKVMIGLAVVFSFAVFHDLGTFRGGTFVHYGEMFHYYLGSKYFKELGYHELYNAVIVADAEQDSALARMPFYTDLKTYKNIPREVALRDPDRLKSAFSEERWNAFKDDVSFFKKATGMPQAPGLMFLLMDHGYNPSPVASLVLGGLTNAVPVGQLQLLALLDVFVVLTMIGLVFRTFGVEIGGVFAVYFFVNILSGHEYISGSLLRYDWLLYIVVAVCLLEKGRYASSAFFLTLSAMLRIFPVVLFFGVAVTIFRKWKTTRALDRNSKRFILGAALSALVLFLLPAASLGSVLQPWKEFYTKTSLHDSGVYVNHLGLRGMVLFEPSQLSLESFVAKYKSADVVRTWQDVKESELRGRRPVIALFSLAVLVALAVLIWKRKDEESVSVLWPTLLVYTTSYLSTYYYVFLCLLVLLFFRRTQPRTDFVSLCLLLGLNLAALVTDYLKPSPIVFFTLINIYLFICLSSMLGFALYANVLSRMRVETAPALEPQREPVGRRRRQARARRK